LYSDLIILFLSSFVKAEGISKLTEICKCMSRGEFDIEDIPEVGPKTAEKLRDAGYLTVGAIAVASPLELVSVADLAEGEAVRIIQAARKLVNIGEFEATSDIYSRRRKSAKRITTGCECLDSLLGGGIRTQALTEIYGNSGCGRTQLCMQLMVTAQLSDENVSVVYIDTENRFRPEKVAKIAERVGLEPEGVLKNVHVARAFNTHHQMLLVDDARKLAEKLKKEGRPVRLIMVDSLATYFKSEYVGRETLADRQQKLNRHLHDLRKFGELNNAAVVFTNLKERGNKMKSFGGAVTSYNADYRIYMRRIGRTDLRIVELTEGLHSSSEKAKIRFIFFRVDSTRGWRSG